MNTNQTAHAEQSVELKACPCCSSKNIERGGRGFYAVVQTYQRICLSCGLRTKEFYSTQEADTAWNTRADSQLQAECARLREFVQKVADDSQTTLSYFGFEELKREAKRALEGKE